MRSPWNSSVWAVLLLAAIYGFSLYKRAVMKAEQLPAGYDIIRIAHFQLEPGYRDALDLIARDFEEIMERQGRKVRVRQLSVNASMYEPWINTQLIAGNAPDIVQSGRGGQDAPDMLERYFLPLEEYISRPNPFNRFDELERLAGDLNLHRGISPSIGKKKSRLKEPLLLREVIRSIEPSLRLLLESSAWKDTYKDGMQKGYSYLAQKNFSYYGSFHGYRIFYNKDLMEKATGSREAPETLQTFFDACEALAALKDKNGVTISPISATKGVPDSMFEARYRSAFMHETYADKLDRNYNGVLELEEIYGGYQAGDWSLDQEVYRAYFACVKQMSDYCEKGYLARSRDQAIFSFTQGRAGMYVTGTYDASTMFNLPFEVGVMAFPMPAEGERYYDYMKMPVKETMSAGSVFHIAKSSENKDLAILFAQFITSYIWNERFNIYSDQLPVVIGASTLEKLKPFESTSVGVRGNHYMSEGLASHLVLDYKGYSWMYYTGELDYENFRQKVDQAWEDAYYGIDRLWYKIWESDWRRALDFNRSRSMAALQGLVQKDGANPMHTDQMRRLLMADLTRLNGSATVWKFSQYAADAGTNRPFPRY